MVFKYCVYINTYNRIVLLLVNLFMYVVIYNKLLYVYVHIIRTCEPLSFAFVYIHIANTLQRGLKDETAVF